MSLSVCKAGAHTSTTISFSISLNHCFLIESIVFFEKLISCKNFLIKLIFTYIPSRELVVSTRDRSCFIKMPSFLSKIEFVFFQIFKRSCRYFCTIITISKAICNNFLWSLEISSFIQRNFTTNFSKKSGVFLCFLAGRAFRSAICFADRSTIPSVRSRLLPTKVLIISSFVKAKRILIIQKPSSKGGKPFFIFLKQPIV